MSVPWWVMIPYGFVEKLAIFYFICRMTGTPLTGKGLAAASALGLAATLALREILPLNHFVGYCIFIVANIAVTSLFFRVYTGDGSLMVWTTAVIATTVMIIVEFPATMMGELYLKDMCSYILFWVITGIPHIAVLLALALIFGKVRSVRDKVSV
ncbi:MAG: hypothetical protein M1609_11955 [Firmicutes bacterium]|nr:hypothetical protein [Bacillota bacterium]